MKVLICLSVVLALANAGHLVHNSVYSNGVLGSGFNSPGGLVNTGLIGSGLYSRNLYSSGLYGNGLYSNAISAPVTYVHQAPAIVRQPVLQTVASPIVTASIIQNAPIYHHSAIVSKPIISAPVLSQSYGLSYGPSYGSYLNKAIIVNNGYLKRQ